MRRPGLLALIPILAGAVALHADQKRWWSHVEALANDGMEGRDTGSAGHKRAADYVAAQFEKAGLEPAGVGGYIQPVAFKTRKIVEAQSSLALVRNGKSETLTLGEDANISMRVDPAPSARSASRTRERWRFRGRAARCRACSRRCRSPTARSKTRPASSSR